MTKQINYEKRFKKYKRIVQNPAMKNSKAS